MICISDYKIKLGNNIISIDNIKISEAEKNYAKESLGMDTTYVQKDTALRDMAVSATKELLSTVDKTSIDTVIFACGGEKDFNMWCEAAYIQYTCEIKNAFAFDIYQGCNSLLLAIHLASSLIFSNSKIRKCLVVAADMFSKIAEHNSMNGILVGDATVALIIEERTNGFALESFDSITDGAFANFTYSLGGLESRITYEDLYAGNEKYSIREPGLRKYVKNASQEYFTKLISGVLKSRENIMDKIKYFLFPNSNKELYLLVQKKLNLPFEKLYFDNISRYGHMGSIDLIINLDSIENKLQKEDKVVLSSMGVGLSWCSLVISDNR